MNQIVVGFSRSRSPWKIGSRIIASVESRNFSHAFIQYNCLLTNTAIVSQASHGFVNEMTLEIFELHNIITHKYTINCEDSEFIDMLKFIRSNLGIPYSMMQIVFIGLRKLFGISTNVNNRDKAFICSEWAARICSILKITVPDNLDTFSPSDLNELLSIEHRAIRVLNG